MTAPRQVFLPRPETNGTCPGRQRYEQAASVARAELGRGRGGPNSQGETLSTSFGESARRMPVGLLR